MYPTFPDVNLRKLPFFRVAAILMQPCSLQPSGTARFQEQKFNFFLSPTQVDSITQSAYRDAMGRPEYKRQIQLRFSLLETSCEQDDNFPSSLCVKVNNRMQALPNPIPTNKPGMEPKRPPKPINITQLSRLSATMPTYLDISWAVEIGRGYTVSVYLVDKLSSADLLKELKEKGTRLADFTRALIKEKLNDKDADICTTSCKVTLACPLGKMRMTYPCRANSCDHLQCFDANLFLMMNERKPKWLCPVCNKPAFFDNLMIDGYFTEVIADRRLPSDDHEIVLHNDGTWDPLPFKKDPRSLPQGEQEAAASKERERNKEAAIMAAAASKQRKVETFNIDDEEETLSSLNSGSSSQASSSGIASANNDLQAATATASDNSSTSTDSRKRPVNKLIS